MTSDVFIASLLIVCLGFFFSVNLRNILRRHEQSDAKPYAEIEHPSGLVVGIAAFGTFAYFVEAIAFPFLVFSNLLHLTDSFLLCFELPFKLLIQVLGLVLTTTGYLLFVWSVLARGKYAVSWAMRSDHKLVTWGPYHYVRHPSYVAYFLMFIGLFALWPNVFTLIPIVAVPGYFKVAIQEDRLLAKRFGQEYEDYEKRTKRFVPKL